MLLFLPELLLVDLFYGQHHRLCPHHIIECCRRKGSDLNLFTKSMSSSSLLDIVMVPSTPHLLYNFFPFNFIHSLNFVVASLENMSLALSMVRLRTNLLLGIAACIVLFQQKTSNYWVWPVTLASSYLLILVLSLSLLSFFHVLRLLIIYPARHNVRMHYNKRLMIDDGVF